MIGSHRSNTCLFRLLRGAVARCLLIAAPLAISPAAHAAYNLTFVTDPTLTGVINLLGINNSGTIAGFDNGVTNAGFTLTLPHAFTVVNFPGAASTQVTGINGAGDLSGFYVDTLGNTHGFTRIGGSFATVDNPHSAVFNQALGINNSNETVGYFAPTATGTPGDVAYSRGRHCRLLYQPHDRHRRRLCRDAGSRAFDLGDDAGRLRGTRFPWLSQGAPGEAGGLRATLMVAVGRATATHLFLRPSCRNEGFP